MAKTDKIASLIPFHSIEVSAQQQIFQNLDDERLVRLAIMPDVHAGFDLPIGTVALVDRHVCPGFVGYDIGCGMCSVDTGVPAAQILPGEKEKKELFQRLLKTIPHGKGGSHGARQEYEAFASALDRTAYTSLGYDFDEKVNKGVRSQLGSLGSGNHFLEISVDEKKNCWVTIHSGSRNPGHSVGTAYMALAKRQKDKYLALDSDLGRAYMDDMKYCLEFALENRRQMLASTLDLMGLGKSDTQVLLETKMINENHNHAILGDDGFVVHRKGATPAESGQFGVIPANMRDGIFVTKGLGNDQYLCSASHGAGRVMSRQQGKQNVRLEDFKSSMKGIVARVDSSTLDESPAVYKDINTVIQAQDGVVVEVVSHLKPLINVKG